jgi:hypothetical protein
MCEVSQPDFTDIEVREQESNVIQFLPEFIPGNLRPPTPNFAGVRDSSLCWIAGRDSCSLCYGYDCARAAATVS